MAGALLALVVRSRSFVPVKFLTGAWITLFVSAPLALLIDTLHARWIVFSLVALTSVSFVYLALFSNQKWLRGMLTNRFLIYTGTISYGIYLLQKIPSGAAPVPGIADNGCRHLSDGGIVVESSGEAVSQVYAILRSK
jgi:hypothetical protein